MFLSFSKEQSSHGIVKDYRDFFTAEGAANCLSRPLILFRISHGGLVMWLGIEELFRLGESLL